MCKQFRNWQIFRKRNTNTIGKPRSANMRTLLLWNCVRFYASCDIYTTFMMYTRFAPPSPRNAIHFVYLRVRASTSVLHLVRDAYELMFIFDFVFRKKSIAPVRSAVDAHHHVHPMTAWNENFDWKWCFVTCLRNVQHGQQQMQQMNLWPVAMVAWPRVHFSCSFCLDLPHVEFIVFG